MKPEKYYAHSTSRTDRLDWQSLAEHLQNVAHLAAKFLQSAGGNDVFVAQAFDAGLLHDLGKYRPEFQQMIRGLKPPRERTYHKQAGASKAAIEFRNVPVSFSIAGHHGGMPNKTDLEASIKSPNGYDVVREIWDTAVRDLPALAKLKPIQQQIGGTTADLLTRMIFSSLVDADWTDTGNHERTTLRLRPESLPRSFKAEEWLTALLRHLNEKSESCKQHDVKSCRRDVLQACLKAAESPPGIFSLTVPTGGGKTLASLAFALKHSITNASTLRRIIYVAPYLTILEQNEKAIRDALGISSSTSELFPHHSLAEPHSTDDNESTDRDAAMRHAENWDAPLILTTSVQFFESLFSNRPGQCRKLHNIARSTVILDECQTIPPEIVAPTCGMLKQLCDEWEATFVLCTATQPAFSHEAIPINDRLTATEIIPSTLRLFDRLKRVSIVWPASESEALSWSELASRITNSPASLCVVNSRRAAREVWETVQQFSSGNAFHLSTSMCPAHRMMVLDEVRRRLRERMPCYLVSTQLIEAGVDIDFPVVFRELAPLESIIQAAGRCNREGLLADDHGKKILGRVIAFRSQKSVEEPRKYFPPDQWYNAGRSILQNHFLNTNHLPRIDEPNDILEYFTRLFYGGQLDKPKIQDDRRNFKFADVAENYRIIQDESVAVVIATWNSYREEVERLLKAARSDPSRTNFRALAPYQVNLRYYELKTVGGSVVPISEKIDQPVWYGRYDENLGLSAEATDALLSV